MFVLGMVCRKVAHIIGCGLQKGEEERRLLQGTACSFDSFSAYGMILEHLFLLSLNCSQRGHPLRYGAAARFCAESLLFRRNYLQHDAFVSQAYLVDTVCIPLRRSKPEH